MDVSTTYLMFFLFNAEAWKHIFINFTVCWIPFGKPVVPDDQNIAATSSSSRGPFCNNGGPSLFFDDSTNSGIENIHIKVLNLFI